MVASNGELDDLTKVELLRLRVVAGKPTPDISAFAFEIDVYSVLPWDILGDKEEPVLCFSPANSYESTRRRKREVAGSHVDSGEVRCWHQDKGKIPIRSRDNKSILAHKRTLYYVSKTKSPHGAPTPFRYRRLGYAMIEMELNQDAGAKKLVLCKLYRSNRTSPASCPALETPRPKEVVLPSLSVHPLPRVQIPRSGSPSMTAAALDKGEVVSVAEEAQEGGAAAAAAELACSRPGFQIPSRMSASVSMTSAALDKGKAIEVAEEAQEGGAAAAGFVVVMKLDSSSVRSAERMKQVAEIILTFPEGMRVVLLLSAMGETTDNLVVAGEKALGGDTQMVSGIDELNVIKELHLTTVHDLGLDISIATDALSKLEQLLKDVATEKMLTSETRDCLVSFGERLSTGIFSAYLKKLGRTAQQYETYSTILEWLGDWNDNSSTPVVAGSLWKEWESCDFTTFGRCGSDLTAATIGTALGPREIWVLRPQAMRPACEGDTPVQVKNLYSRDAPGNLITETRDMCKGILTGIDLNSNITVLDIKSTSKLGQQGFLGKVLQIFEHSGISIDRMTSQGRISLTILLSEPLICEQKQPDLPKLIGELEKIADVRLLQHRSVISLTGSAQMPPMALNVLRGIDVKVQMILQGMSESEMFEVSFVIEESEAQGCVRALEAKFFENGSMSEVQGAEECPMSVNSSYGIKKRKMEPITADGHIGPSEEIIALVDLEHKLSSDEYPMHAEVDNGDDLALEWASLLQQPGEQVLAEEEEFDALLADVDVLPDVSFDEVLWTFSFEDGMPS